MWPFFLTGGAFAVWGAVFAVLLNRSAAFRDCKNKLLTWLLGTLPFCSGGFYPFLSIPVSGLLIFQLLRERKKPLRVYMCPGGAALLGMLLCFGLTILWAVDRGMAPFGLISFLPVALLGLVLMQLEPEEKSGLYRGVPLSAAVMTCASIPLTFVPAFRETLMPDNRLAGFMEYPNTYALFLLVGVILSLTREEFRKRDYLMAAISMLGILLSGSRTTFILLVLALGVICLTGRRIRLWAGAFGILVLTVTVSTVASRLGVFQEGGRYLTTSAQSSTFLTRLLYFRDALGVVLTHPFGMGYMGYAGIQGSIQHGVYHVTYVHNELLQLLMDVGWIPVALLIWAFVRAFFKKRASCRNRLLLIAILGHCMMDFDLQFLAVWFLLVPLLELHEGKSLALSRRTISGCGAVAMVLVLWLGTGDLLYRSGAVEACLKVTPFHTLALTRQLPGETDLAVLEETADRILKLNSHVSLAYSAKANAAYGAGDIRTMIESKTGAIENSPYDLEEYTDYFDKLYAAMDLYKKQGDAMSAEKCRQEILKIPRMIADVLEETDTLAWKIQHVPELELPQEYIDKLDALEHSAR